MSLMSKDLMKADAIALATQIANGRLHSRDLVTNCLQRIQEADEFLSAFAEVYAESAIHDAELRDQQAAAGDTAGPLHGVPIAFKDLVDIAGRPTRAGSKLFDDYTASQTASVVTRLEAAGMVTLGKTRMVEFAYGGWGTNAADRTPRNPWGDDRHRVPGGSSSGSAVAVAAGLVPAAIGTDTGGSVRIPAAMCGVVGLKVTAGRIPVDHLIPLSPTLDTVGTLTRSVVH